MLTKERNKRTMAPSTKKSASTKSDASAPAPVAAAPAAEPAKKGSKKAEAKSKKEEVVAAVEPVAAAAAPAKSTSKKSSSTKSESASVAAAPAASSTTEAVPEGDEEKKGQRREVTKQSVSDDFSALLVKIQEEITKRTAAPAPAEPAADGAAPAASKKPKRKKDTGVPVKFLRSIWKRLSTLQNDACKMMRLKNKTTRDNQKSGLMKPVGISDSLYSFLKQAKFEDNFEVQKNGKYARVEITRRIHSYVKDNNLRNEKDKRVIIPDDKLAKLLSYDKNTAKEELTYFRLPQYLKNHFVKE